jgi:magnesium-transporting ATPase (P-type)
MQLINNSKSDIKALQEMRLPWWGVLCVVVSSALIAWLFDHFGRLELARPVLYSIGMLGVAIAIKWKLREHVWFWITMAILAALHILLILLVPWTAKWIPALVVIPLAIADVYVMLWIISVVGKFMGEPTAPPDKHRRSRSVK